MLETTGERDEVESKQIIGKVLGTVNSVRKG